MKFLLISQRAKANPNYNLKDLPGHGRYDVVIRCILSAGRQLLSDQGEKIFCYLKGSEPHGWLTIDSDYVRADDDEISLAARIKEDWGRLFTIGILDDLVDQLDRPLILLAEDGDSLQSTNGTIVLGAQRDLTDEDQSKLKIDQTMTLGSRSLLASQAIVYYRQQKYRITRSNSE